MLLIPAIDLKDGQCVRLRRGDYATAARVADSALDTARAFAQAGAKWLHVVDLDGAKAGRPVNEALILRLVRDTGLCVEVGGGIRDMACVARYLEGGAQRVILGSAALEHPAFVQEAIRRYGAHIAVGIDARDGKVATHGWLHTSEVAYIRFAREMAACGAQTIIFTDISRDGMLSGPNLAQLDALNRAVSCRIIASGGVSNLQDIEALRKINLYGAISGKALYTGDLSLQAALQTAQQPNPLPDPAHLELDRFFQKSELVPAIVQEASSGQVLMLAYMNRESLRRTLETGYTWFWSRSRRELWHKGATSGHVQRVLSIAGDCDSDTLLLRVVQTGSACHTGSHSCFYDTIWEETSHA